MSHNKPCNLKGVWSEKNIYKCVIHFGFELLFTVNV